MKHECMEQVFLSDKDAQEMGQAAYIAALNTIRAAPGYEGSYQDPCSARTIFKFSKPFKSTVLALSHMEA